METPVANSGWTEDEQARIAAIMEERGVSRGQAIRVMRAEKVRGVVSVLEHGRMVEQPAAPAPELRQEMQQPDELNAKLAELGDKAPHVAAKIQKEKPVKTKSTPKPKKEAKKKLSMSKEERMALAKKSDKSELEIYMGLCKKEGVEPAKSAQRAWDKAQKAAAKAKAAK